MKSETQEARDKRLARMKRWYAANRERCISNSAEWHRTHKAQAREYSKRYKEKNREAIRKRQSEYNGRPETKARVNQWWKSPKGIATHYRNAAKIRGIEWALPHGLAIDLATDHCFYCGAAPAPTSGIDRVDNTKGYLEDNVVAACRHCNRAKLERSRDDFEAWALRLADHTRRYSCTT